MMTVLKFVRGLFVAFALVFLFLGAAIHGIGVQDRLDVDSERSVGRQVADPEDLSPEIKRSLMNSLFCGSAWVLLSGIIWVVEDIQKKRIRGRILNDGKPHLDR